MYRFPDQNEDDFEFAGVTESDFAKGMCLQAFHR